MLTTEEENILIDKCLVLQACRNSMSSIEPCMALDVNPSIWKQLNELNIKLKFQAAAITKEINSLSTQDQSINSQLSQTRSKMNTLSPESAHPSSEMPCHTPSAT